MGQDESSVAKDVLTSRGFTVEDIPCEEVKTPDFLVRDGCSRYLIEFKTKLPNPETVKERDAALADNGIYSSIQPLSQTAILRKITSKAVTQLTEHASDDQIFRLMWLHAIGHDAECQRQRFESSLYGKKLIVDWAKKGISKDCYYFQDSLFFRYRDKLDGAFVSAGNTGCLCVNTLSTRYCSFKVSKLVEKFGDGLLDPNDLESQGLAMIADTKIDRKDIGAVVAYVKEKYKLGQPKPWDMDCISTETIIPKSNDSHHPEV